jgi:hypothetical protein
MIIVIIGMLSLFIKEIYKLNKVKTNLEIKYDLTPIQYKNQAILGG